MNFWERVSVLSELKNISKKEIASVANIDVSTISKGLKDNTYPSADKAAKIADYLGISVDYLITGKLSEDYVKDENDILVFIEHTLSAHHSLNNRKVERVIKMIKDFRENS